MMLLGYLPTKNISVFFGAGIVGQPEKSENLQLKRSGINFFPIRTCQCEKNLIAFVL